MVKHYTLLLALFFVCTGFPALSQSSKFGFDQLLKTQAKTVTSFGVPNDTRTKAFLLREHITIKYQTSNWLFISSTPEWIDTHYKSGDLSNFYFEHYQPVALADTAVVVHHVKEVHDGSNGLNTSYTGKGVIIGYVDQGIDWNHPDFIDSNGQTRVLRYWDHSTNTGGTVLQPYNYGIVWTNNEINNGSCTSTESGTAHGTTVAGMGSGNGRANGLNKGIAPESYIIVVETNFNLPNWTLTVADACDYIFKLADSLGMPAVVNLSVGSYLGSHDAKDPAGEYIDSLLAAKDGRIVVCAAGNAGAQGKYHVTGNVTADTSFVWIENNTSSSAAFGANHIYFDLWSSQADATFDFAFGADLPSPTYGLRGTTVFRNATSFLNSSPLYDTLYSVNGDRIATIELYTEIVNGDYHMEAYFSNVDSTAYLYRFMTKGSGKYDLWSGTWMGLNNLVSTIPSVSTFPAVAHYFMPDTLQTIVSSWACSDKVITVANMRNRFGHTDKNGNYNPSSPSQYITPGSLSINSSKGPSRTGSIKPDITAGGDFSLTAAPLWLLNTPSYNSVIDIDGWHARNGGTSMASPVIAGIAALYLEQCDRGNYQTFKDGLTSTAFTDNFTGITPNYAFGYGKAHALNLLLENSFTASIQNAPDSMCADTILNLYTSAPISTAWWSDGYEGISDTITVGGEYFAYAYNAEGCKAVTDTVYIEQLEVNPMLPIVQYGNTLNTLSYTTYQWTLNGVDIPGANGPSIQVGPPYGTFTCYSYSVDGCKTETDAFLVSALGIDELANAPVKIYPNPTTDIFTIETNLEVTEVHLFDLEGKEVPLVKTANNTYSTGHLSKGIYQLETTTAQEKIYSKISRL